MKVKIKKRFLIAVIGAIVYFGINTEVKSQTDNAKTEKQKGSVFVVVEEMPKYPGGVDAQVKFLTNNVKFPELARKEGVTGKVYVTFVIEKDGSVSNVRVIRGIGSGCDEEAIRVVKAMPKWIPGKQKGKTVRVQFNLPIVFNLN